MSWCNFIAPPNQSYFVFFNDTATTEIYTLSLHDALPIFPRSGRLPARGNGRRAARGDQRHATAADGLGRCYHHAPLSRATRSEEHTSELQSRQYLVCRLLLEKKNNQIPMYHIHTPCVLVS